MDRGHVEDISYPTPSKRRITARDIPPYELSSWIDNEVAARKLYSKTDISVAELADELGISERRLIHTINNAYSRTVTEYLEDRRIQAACRMLREQPDRSIEEIGTGPNELFIQKKRDYHEHPLTPGETKQRGNWQQACRDAQVILHDKSHPRFMELYHRWREHLKGPEPHKQFPPFVRTVLLNEQ